MRSRLNKVYAHDLQTGFRCFTSSQFPSRPLKVWYQDMMAKTLITLNWLFKTQSTGESGCMSLIQTCSFAWVSNLRAKCHLRSSSTFDWADEELLTEKIPFLENIVKICSPASMALKILMVFLRGCRQINGFGSQKPLIALIFRLPSLASSSTWWVIHFQSSLNVPKVHSFPGIRVKVVQDQANRFRAQTASTLTRKLSSSWKVALWWMISEANAI